MLTLSNKFLQYIPGEGPPPPGADPPPPVFIDQYVIMVMCVVLIYAFYKIKKRRKI